MTTVESKLEIAIILLPVLSWETCDELKILLLAVSPFGTAMLGIGEFASF